MTTYAAVQIGMCETLSPSQDSKSTKRVSGREMSKGNVSGENICRMWGEDDGLFSGSFRVNCLVSFPPI